MLSPKNNPSRKHNHSYLYIEPQTLSISVTSNIPGFEEAQCFVREEEETRASYWIGQFIDYIGQATEEAYQIMNKRFDSIIVWAKNAVEELKKSESQSTQREEKTLTKYMMLKMMTTSGDRRPRKTSLRLSREANSSIFWTTSYS